jgi:hypothetical protein
MLTTTMTAIQLPIEDWVKRRRMQRRHGLYAGRDRATKKLLLRRRLHCQRRVMSWHFVLIYFYLQIDKGRSREREKMI